MSKLTYLFSLRKHPMIKSVGIYTFTNFFTKSISFLLLFVFTNPRFITPSENGLLSLFSNSLLFLMPFLSMGIIHSTSADFFKLEKKQFRNFFTTGFILPLIVTVISCGVLIIFRDFLYKTYGFPFFFAWLIPAVTFFTFCNEQLLSLSRSNDDPVTYFKANIFRLIIELGLSVILVVLFAWRWEGRIAGILVAHIFIAFYALYYFVRKDYLFGKVETKYIKSELVYAVPIISLQVCLFVLYASDKFFLSHFTSDNNETVGIYSIASIFAAIVFTLCNALLQYLFPRIYTILAASPVDYPAIRKLFFLYTGVMAAGTLGIILFTPLIYHFFINDRYAPALSYFYLLCLGYFFWSISYFFFSFLLYHKDKKRILLFSFLGISISLVGNYFLIRQWNAAGAALSVCLSYLLVLLITLWITRKYVIKLFFDK